MSIPNNRKSPVNFGTIMIRVAASLFILTAITVYLLAGVLARYVTTGTGSDSARVVKFGNLTLTETGDFDGTASQKGMIIPGVDLTKDASVNFEKSEVATVVFVEVITNYITSDHKNYSYNGELKWSVESGWEYLITDTYEGKTRHVYYQTVDPNEGLTADIIAENGKIAVSEAITKATITALGSGYITLRASVIQSGGFESVEAAWAAMAAK